MEKGVAIIKLVKRKEKKKSGRTKKKRLTELPILLT